MKICFLFRGETIRGSANALNNVENWQAMLFKDLPRQDYDITFITYESPILEMLTSFLKPKILLIKPSISQIQNMRDIADYCLENKDTYDRFIILRFDVLYRIPLLSWNIWNKPGITLVNRDAHWYDEKLYSDHVFIVDKDFTEPFRKGVYHTTRQPHQVGQYLALHKVPINLMYDTFHTNESHPLYTMSLESVNNTSFKAIEIENPLLNNPIYSSFLEKGMMSTNVCKLIISSKKIFFSKLSEINYLKTVFDSIICISDFTDDIKLIYSDSQFIFNTSVQCFTINLETFSLINDFSRNHDFAFEPITYKASGLLGDFIQELSVIAENFYKTGRKGVLYISNEFEFRFGTQKAYEDTEQIIKQQVYIKEYTIWKNQPYNINLSSWRQSPLLYKTNWREIFQSVYSIPWGSHPWIEIPRLEKWKDIVIINAAHYRNISPNINYPEISKQFGTNLIFMSFNQEDYFIFLDRTRITLEYYCPNSLYEFIQAIVSCKLFIGELSAPLSIAFACHTQSIVPYVEGDGDSIHNYKFNLFWKHVNYSFEDYQKAQGHLE
jgi:hypothetical protein